MAMAKIAQRATRRHVRTLIVGCVLLLFSLLAVAKSFADTRDDLDLLDYRNTAAGSLLQFASSQDERESIQELRNRLSPCVWSQAGSNSDKDIAGMVDSLLEPQERKKATELCGKFLYSSVVKAIRVGDMGEQTFVSTGDIDDMWTRDSAVQISLYVSRLQEEPFLRPIVEGAIRRQAFNIIQDPYANAYERQWVDPSSLPLRDRVIGRGGWVATRNYELDSGAYFLTQIYDYYVVENLYKPEALLAEPLIFDTVMLMINTWIIEQHHDDKSPYRYFELSNQGKGAPTAYTGMTWTGFRPSDDECKYGYLIPANIFAAGALERTLSLNQHVWQSDALDKKATKLLREIEDGIRQHGVAKAKDTGESIYVYETDGMGNSLADFDDANVPSLLSIPLLGWTGFDREIYKNTRNRLLSTKNPYYFSGKILKGIGSPHTPNQMVWPMALAIEALTTEGSKEEVAKSFVFQLRQSLASACDDAMHESVHVDSCHFSRAWFEWANALFVVLVESALGIRCDSFGLQQARDAFAAKASATENRGFYNNKYNNNHTQSGFYQGIEAMVPHYE
jgi:meiotically up-regulated gene 157 (Mug157) protein